MNFEDQAFLDLQDSLLLHAWTMSVCKLLQIELEEERIINPWSMRHNVQIYSPFYSEF